MIIDSHAHVMLPTEKQLLMMEEAGVDKTILFTTSIHPEKAEDLKALEKEISILNNVLAGALPVEERIKSLKKSTKELKQAVASNPSKFIGFGMVPLTLNYEDSGIWIEENIVKNDFLGMGEFSPASGHVKDLEVIFQASKEFGNLPIWIHTFHPLTLQDIKEIVELAKKYYKVPVILGHMGGINWIETIKLAKESSNIYLDLSAAYTTMAPSIAIKEIPSRVLFSSDAPFGNPKLGIEMVKAVTKDRRSLKRVLGENVLEILER
ncbi:amidohydrolase family protein [Clostridium sp. 19966]|uniref:amidohydrolase family protein n=1 Tax=Clostridium sp. 19966 TaxID=2768166 RepID=UPI0028DEA54C|nr:amidohydrolase family protein [Clostridium sp. 19966]MDT8716889.1 amidohydrolase family protein [Clostridium sp. 19966]